MNALLIAQLINASLTVISSMRRFIGTNAELQERLNSIDGGGQGITAAEVQAKLTEWEDEIEAGRAL